MFSSVKRVLAALNGELKRRGRVVHDEIGFTRYLAVGRDEKLIDSAKWAEVNRAFAFKRHLYIVDQICLEFETERGAYLAITEDDEGWDGIRDNLDLLLPGCRSFSDWFREVAFPAFETNRTQIYSRPKLDDSNSPC